MSEQENRAAGRVAVLVDHLDGAVRPTALELLTLARGLGREVHAVWVGNSAPSAELAAHGADAVHEVAVDGADAQLTASVVDALQTVLPRSATSGCSSSRPRSRVGRWPPGSRSAPAPVSSRAPRV